MLIKLIALQLTEAFSATSVFLNSFGIHIGRGSFLSESGDEKEHNLLQFASCGQQNYT